MDKRAFTAAGSVLFLMAAITACGGGGTSNTSPSARPSTSPAARGTIGPPVSGAAVPATSGSDLSGLFSGGSAEALYLRKLAAIVPMPRPPSLSKLAVVGQVELNGGNALTLNINPVPAPTRLFAASNLTIPTSTIGEPGVPASSSPSSSSPTLP